MNTSKKGYNLMYFLDWFLNYCKLLFITIDILNNKTLMIIKNAYIS